MRDVRRGLADKRGEQLLMRRRPRNLLDDDMNARVAALELGDEVLDNFALAAEGPELEVFAVVGWVRGTSQEKCEEYSCFHLERL